MSSKKCFKVTALEKFLVRTVYFVKAKNEDEAKRKVRDGEVAYDSCENQEGDEEWIRTEKVEFTNDEDDTRRCD